MRYLFALCLMIAVASVANAQDETPFTGKTILVVSVNGQHTSNDFLKGARLEQIGKRAFLIGEASLPPSIVETGEQNWKQDAQVMIAWNDVSAVYLYSDQQLDKNFKPRYHKAESNARSTGRSLTKEELEDLKHGQEKLMRETEEYDRNFTVESKPKPLAENGLEQIEAMKLQRDKLRIKK